MRIQTNPMSNSVLSQIHILTQLRMQVQRPQRLPRDLWSCKLQRRWQLRRQQQVRALNALTSQRSVLHIQLYVVILSSTFALNWCTLFAPAIVGANTMAVIAVLKLPKAAKLKRNTGSRCCYDLCCLSCVQWNVVRGCRGIRTLRWVAEQRFVISTCDSERTSSFHFRHTQQLCLQMLGSFGKQVKWRVWIIVHVAMKSVDNCPRGNEECG